jgi:hypothetical protein
MLTPSRRDKSKCEGHPRVCIWAYQTFLMVLLATLIWPSWPHSPTIPMTPERGTGLVGVASLLGRPSRLDHAQLDRLDSRLGAIGDLELQDDIACVLLHGAHAKVKLAGDLLVGVTARHQPQHLLFAW